ncbi:hypothetical protein BDV95DRAFT_478724 [Massariosphaeria phaeospora]|uniref:Ribosomal protein s17 n=1 Tax=Massariosphaeria phaeospora TaxID=100035 RepID=A0A7C8IME8_9PLEO|nr:hypothetical protein BDV95DRAFT_478724 [Massariosphaeria phaeospora]
MPLLLAAGVARAQVGAQNNNQNNNQNQNQQNNQNQNQDQNNNQNNNQDNANANADALALDPANVQDASAATGLEGGAAEDGQAASETDAANFINFCTGKTLTNGLQVEAGSCNGIPMGDIPAAAQMVSAIFIEPQNQQDFAEFTEINFQVQIANLEAGTFTNPDNTYYAAPQTLNNGGVVIGHTHITVQDLLGEENPTDAPDAGTFAFFKGINDAGDGNGLLAAPFADGLPAGNYRACSMTSSSNHQPVLMPVAQRGAQDDCVRFTVGQGNANANGNANNNNNNNNQQAGQGQDAQAGQGQDAQAGQGQDAQAGQGQDAQAGQGQDAQAGQGQDAQAGQGQDAQAGQGQAAQAGQGQDAQAGQGQGAGRRGRGRFGRTKFAARDFVA